MSLHCSPTNLSVAVSFLPCVEATWPTPDQGMSAYPPAGDTVSISCISCPLCIKLLKRLRGLVRESPARHDCQFCNGSREIRWSRVQRISDQMQRVADAMQAGDEDRAAAEGRLAGHLALGVLAAEAWAQPTLSGHRASAS